MNLIENIDTSSYEEDLALMELIPRDAYMEIYKIIGNEMWEQAKIPTVGDIVDMVNGTQNDTIDSITGFLGNKEKLEVLLKRESASYTNEESEMFIKKVISSNVTDISASGWAYKKLMSSTDDIRIIEEDCESEGRIIDVSDIDKTYYDYAIKYSYVNELGTYSDMIYEEFMQEVIDFDTVSVRTPIRCNNIKERKLCSKCSGIIRRSHESAYIPENFGVFSTLMITEHATQASLDSMNKGLSKNINNILDKRFPSKRMLWDDVVNEIEDIVNVIGDVGVQARFYEAALASRIFENSPGRYSASSFQYSIVHQNDALGAYIFSSTKKNLVKLISRGEFEADSIKTKVMFDIYD